MKSNLSSKTLIIALTLATALLAAACSPTAEKLNQDGNQAFTDQAYDEAQISYQSAAQESPELAEPYYNLANTLYRKGGFDQAIQQIQQAISLTSEEDLAQNSLYNLGNNTYNLQDFATSIEAYKQALLLNPDDQDAKYNLELALQQMQQQEQEQQDQEQEQDQEDQSEEEQQQDQEQNQDGESEDQQDPDQDEQGEENQDQEGEQDPQDEEGQNPDESQQDQNQDGQEGDPSEEEGQEQNQPWGTPQPGERMTEEQAKQLLAALLQNSQTLQEKLGQILFVRDLPPIQDW